MKGKTLFVPRLDPILKGRMDFLRVYGEDDLASFPAGLWGIREPEEHYQGGRRQSGLYCSQDRAGVSAD